MRALKRSLLAIAVTGGLYTGVGSARAADTEKFPHMHHALAHLRYAKDELTAAGGAFKARSAETIASIDFAIKEIDDGLKGEGDSSDTPADSALTDRDSEANFAHLHHGLDRLTEARVELENAETVFAGHRGKAINSVDNAIRIVEDSLHDVQK